MYPKILVPLDGSEVAESALKEVERLVKGGMVREITLLSVVAISKLAASEGLDLPVYRKSRYEMYEKYLEEVRSRIASEGIVVNTVIREGDAASIINEHVRNKGIDLIVIATHGYSGMKKLMFGSVALRVMHDSDVPVLLIRPKPVKE